jgi:hypothetical protein
VKKVIIFIMLTISGLIAGLTVYSYCFHYFEDFIDRQCDERSKGNFCEVAGIMRIVDGDYQDSFGYFEKGCVLGKEQACNFVGVGLYVGFNGYINKLFSYALFENACGLGDKYSCFEKNVMSGKEMDIDDLIENCEKSNHLLSCKRAGEYYFHGKNNVTSNYEKSVNFLTLPCDQLKDESCYLLSISESKIGNDIKAQQAFNKANLQFPFIDREIVLKIKALYLLGNLEKTRNVILKETDEKPHLAIWILKDSTLRKTVEDDFLRGRYLDLLEKLKVKNMEYLKTIGGVQ